MNKTYRHGQILKLLQQKQIHTQEELAERLADLGVPATQVTLSRDIRELNLVKTAQGYQRLEAAARPATGPSPEAIVAEFLTDAREAQQLLVLKTQPGHASSLAAALDASRWPEIVGTLAGDDTVLVVTPNEGKAKQLRQKLLHIAQGE